MRVSSSEIWTGIFSRQVVSEKKGERALCAALHTAAALILSRVYKSLLLQVPIKLIYARRWHYLANTHTHTIASSSYAPFLFAILSGCNCRRAESTISIQRVRWYIICRLIVCLEYRRRYRRVQCVGTVYIRRKGELCIAAARRC